MKTMATPESVTPPSARPWYREPYVWLVVGLPLVAIIGSVTSAIIAIQVMANDPLINRTPKPSVVLDAEMLDKLSPEQRAAFEKSIAPARVVRNHAVSPELPKE